MKDIKKEKKTSIDRKYTLINKKKKSKGAQTLNKK
jgi:hypothetical protein